MHVTNPLSRNSTYKLESVPGDQNLTFLCKIVPTAKIKNEICKLTPEDVLRTMASLGSG